MKPTVKYYIMDTSTFSKKYSVFKFQVKYVGCLFKIKNQYQ